MQHGRGKESNECLLMLPEITRRSKILESKPKRVLLPSASDGQQESVMVIAHAAAAWLTRHFPL